jgi:hypothetical protein
LLVRPLDGVGWTTYSAVHVWRLSAELSGFTTADVKRLWPVAASPNTRAWIEANLSEGRVSSARGDVALRVGDAQVEERRSRSRPP